MTRKNDSKSIEGLLETCALLANNFPYFSRDVIKDKVQQPKDPGFTSIYHISQHTIKGTLETTTQSCNDLSNSSLLNRAAPTIEDPKTDVADQVPLDPESRFGKWRNTVQETREKYTGR